MPSNNFFDGMLLINTSSKVPLQTYIQALTIRTSVALSLIILATIPLIVIGVVLVAKISGPISEKQQASLGDLDGYIEEMVNGHVAKTIRIERLAQMLTLFMLTARKFLTQLSFGGPLYFRFKINNTRALRALLGKQQATVLEDYLRMDRNLSLAELDTKLPDILENILHETAWSLGLQTDEAEIRALLKSYLAEAE